MGKVEEILTAMMVTNTVFRKSSLDLFLKNVVPGTFNHWPYHTDLLIF